MMKLLERLRRLLALSLSAFLFVVLVNGAVRAEQNLVFDGTLSNRGGPQAQFVEALLERAYADLGYNISYRPMPLGRSFVEANAGRIDGLRARVSEAESAYPNLIPIPVPLFNFELFVIADRRHCGICDVSMLKSVATIRGFAALEQYLADKKFSFSINRYARTQRVLDLVNAGKMDAALLPESALPKDLLETNPHLILYSLHQFVDYHYLHARHRDLVEPIAARIAELEASGFVDELRQQYQVDPVLRAQTELPKVITVSTAPWVGYADTESGTYRRLLKDIFAPLGVKVAFKLSNWRKAKEDFYRGNVDAVAGVYRSEQGNGVLSEIHVDYEYPVKAYGLKQDVLLAMLAGDKPGTACQQLGFDLHHFLPNPIAPYEQPDIDSCVTMLESGRVDMLLEMDYNITEEEKKIFFSAEILPSLPLFMAFNDTAEGRALQQHFDRGYRQLLLSGKGPGYYPSQEIFEYAKLMVSDKE